ncbi:hypothetical protein ABPG72_022155 [Tetrahymena utriculariae]
MQKMLNSDSSKIDDSQNCSTQLKFFQKNKNIDDSFGLNNMINKREDTILSEQISNHEQLERYKTHSKIIISESQKKRNSFEISSFKSRYNQKNSEISIFDYPINITDLNKPSQIIIQPIQTQQQNLLVDDSFSKVKKEHVCINKSSFDEQQQLQMKTLAQSQMQANNIGFIMKIRRKILHFYQTRTPSGRRSYLKDIKVRQYINDLSDIWTDNNQICLRSYFYQFVQFFQYKNCKLVKQIPLFNPQHPVYFFFNLLFCFLNIVFYTFFSCAVVFQFQLTYEDHFFTTVSIFWIIEIIKKLNTSIYINVNLVKDRYAILGFYIKNQAIYDFLAFFLFLSSQDNRLLNIILKIISFLKLKNVYKEASEIEKQLCIAIENYYYVQIANLILKTCLLGHIIAFIWYLVGQIELNYLQNENTWYESSIGKDGEWWKLYLQAYYWALTLMATGSNLAETPLQIFFTSFIMPFTTIIFGYLIGMIGVILSEIGEEEEKKRKDINVINKYMRIRNISKNIQRVVNLDLEYYYQKNFKKIQEENQQVLTKISCHLNEKLKTDYFGKIFSKIGFLNQNFGQETIEKLSLSCQEQYFLPNQIIFNENDKEDLSLIYIVEGEVELSRQVSSEEAASKILRVVKQDSVFGELSFFTGNQRNASAKATTFTTILKVSRQQFIEIVKGNDKEFQQLCLIKDNILQYNDYRLLQIKCRICHDFKHFESDCPIMHFDRDETNKRIRTFEKFKQNRTQVVRNITKTKNIRQVALLLKPEYSYLFQTQIDPISNLTQSKQDVYDDEYDRYNERCQTTKKKLFTLTQIDSHFAPVESIMINGATTSIQNNYVEEERQRANTDFYSQHKQSGDPSLKYLKSDLAVNVNQNLSPYNKPTSQSQISQLDVKESQLDISAVEEDEEEEEGEEDVELDNQINKSVQFNKMMSMFQYIVNANNMKSMRSKFKKFDQQQTLISRDNEKKIMIDMQNREHNFLWLMDQLKDYLYYFPDGNSSHTITSFHSYQRRKIKKIFISKKKNIIENSTNDTQQLKIKTSNKKKSNQKQIKFAQDKK